MQLLLFSDLIVLAGQLSDAGDCPLRYLDEIAIDEMYDNFPLFMLHAVLRAVNITAEGANLLHVWMHVRSIWQASTAHRCSTIHRRLAAHL
eukprot:COSAG01_NODE_42063_length_444_cov_0.591304_1_plen_90_part_10